MNPVNKILGKENKKIKYVTSYTPGRSCGKCGSTAVGFGHTSSKYGLICDLCFDKMSNIEQLKCDRHEI